VVVNVWTFNTALRVSFFSRASSSSGKANPASLAQELESGVSCLNEASSAGCQGTAEPRPAKMAPMVIVLAAAGG